MSIPERVSDKVSFQDAFATDIEVILEIAAQSGGAEYNPQHLPKDKLKRRHLFVPSRYWDSSKAFMKRFCTGNIGEFLDDRVTSATSTLDGKRGRGGSNMLETIILK